MSWLTKVVVQSVDAVHDVGPGKGGLAEAFDDDEEEEPPTGRDERLERHRPRDVRHHACKPLARTPEAEESVATQVTSEVRVARQERERHHLRRQRSERRSPDSESRESQVPEDQDVVQGDVGERERRGGRNENASTPDAHVESAVRQVEAVEENGERGDRQKCVHGFANLH
jgi:hypothetical protein